MRRDHFVFAALTSMAVFGSALLDSQRAAGQSTTRGSGRSAGGRATAQQPFEVRLWRYLLQSNYRNWAPGPGQNGDFYEGQSPHGAYLKMYLNRAAIADPANLPHGSVVIKENYAPDRKTLMAVTVMYRSKGFDAKNNDWYWVKYNPDGTVAAAPPDKGGMKLAGRVNGCIQCHGSADGNDLVFVND